MKKDANKVSGTPSTTKNVKGFRFQIEHYPNPNIVCVHTRKIFPKSQTDSLMMSHLNKAKGNEERKGNRHPLIKSIRRLKGVLKVSSELYELRIEKATLFQWEELLPKVRRALKKQFADGKELEEAPERIPSAEYLASLRSQGCDV